MRIISPVEGTSKTSGLVVIPFKTGIVAVIVGLFSSWVCGKFPYRIYLSVYPLPYVGRTEKASLTVTA